MNGAEARASPTNICNDAHCYSIDLLDGSRHPKAFLGLGGKPEAMWYGPNGVWLFDSSKVPTEAAIPSGGNVVDLAPVVSDSAVGALWRDDTSMKVRFTMLGGMSKEVDVCFPTPTSGFRGLTMAGRGQLWSSTVTHDQGSSIITEVGLFGVVGANWQAATTCKTGGDQVLNGVKHPGTLGFQRGPSAAKERVHFAFGGVAAGTGEVSVAASYLETTPGKVELVRFGKYSMTGKPTAKLPGSGLVDLPRVAYADDRVLVAWRDAQNVFGGNATLRLRRFKFQCP